MILIQTSGGLVTDIYSDDPAEIGKKAGVFDLDPEGADEDELVDLFGDGDPVSLSRFRVQKMGPTTGANLKRALYPPRGFGYFEPERVDCRHGAPMGRAAVWPGRFDDAAGVFKGDAPTPEQTRTWPKLRLSLVRMCGDYDSGGAYWGMGCGDRLYAAYTNDRSVVIYVRAKGGRAGAAVALEAYAPGARLVRTAAMAKQKLRKGECHV